MKAYELLREDTQERLRNDLQDVLIQAKGQNNSAIDTASVVSQLSSMGYDVSPESLMQLISEIPLVVSADVDSITLDTNADAAPSEQDTGDDSAEAVKKMAQRATEKEL